jgi:DNA-binding transcriptional LysR family regulator
MTLVQLRHLIALAETGSFTRAALTVFLTQSAFSRSIRALEEELGQPIFDRIGKRSELTPFGREVLQRARHLVFEADELGSSGRQMRIGRAGTIRIGLGSGPGAILMKPLLIEMATRHPSVRLEIARGHTSLLVQALRDRELDALVADVRALTPAGDLKLGKMTEMRGALMCRPGHPLTRWKGPLRFAALRQYPIASTPLSDEVARVLVERYGPDAHPSTCVTLRCEELQSLVEVVRKTDAILVAIRSCAPDLVELPIKPTIDLPARFGMVTLVGRAEAPGLPIVRELMERLLHD